MSGRSRPPSLAFLLDITKHGGPDLSPVTLEVVTRLRDAGDVVELLVPESIAHDLARLRPQHDLYVLKEKSPLNLSLAGALTIAGANLVNSFAASSLARDKIAATMAISGAGLPVPPSWAAGVASRFRPLLEDGPLWLKTPRGCQGEGVIRIVDSGNLSEEPLLDPYGLPLPAFAQREAPSSGGDLKVYVIGEEVFAIRRIYPARTLDEKHGTPSPMTDGIREAALACGRALGLELFGVDFLVDGSHFTIVDVNALPGYKGIAEAPQHVAAYLHRRAVRARNGGT